MGLRRTSYTVGHVEAHREPRTPFAWLHRLHQLKIEHQFLGRYSVDKLHAFHQYQASARWWRVAAVLCLTPVPTLLMLIAMDAVPMNDPRAGASHNAVCFVRSVVSHGVMTAVCMLPMRQALRLDESGQYSLYRVALIGLLTCIGLESVWIPTAFLWRFPVPFREMLGVPVWGTLVLLIHRLLTPRVFSRRPRRTKLYLVVVSAQITLFYGFLALSMAFAHVPTHFQVLMMLCFPLVKIAIKRFIWHYARQLDDISTDVTVCMVEISGSLYQTVCLQFATSTVIGLVIMVTDFAQAMLDVHTYLGTEYIVDGRSTLSTAFAILESSVFPGADERPSNANYSSTTSVPSQHSASGRHSGSGSPNGPAIKRRRRRPQAGSVFVPPKLVKTHTSRRLLDLRRFNFDSLDGPGAKVDAIERRPPEIDVDDDERTQAVVENTLANGPEENVDIKSTTYDVDMQFEDSNGSGNSQSTGSQPAVRPPAGIVRSSSAGTSRVVTHTDYTKLVNTMQKRMSAPSSAFVTPNMNVVLKSTSSSAQASGSTVRLQSLSQLIRRPSATNSSSSAASAPSTTKSSLHVPFRRLSTSQAKVQPAIQATPAAATVTPSPPKPEETLPPPTARHSLEPSRHSTLASAHFHRTASHDSHHSSQPPTHIKDRRRRGSSGGEAGGTTGGSATAVVIDSVRIVRKDQARILEQTLQLLFSCEVLLFVEYMEVVMPVLYSLCLGAASLLPNARYNLLTRPLTTAAVISTFESSFIYAFLELLSLLVLHYVVHHKYGISSFHLLAFVLETYALTLQGKLVGAFIVIWNTATLHQGVDFTFRFDYNALMATHTG